MRKAEQVTSNVVHIQLSLKSCNPKTQRAASHQALLSQQTGVAMQLSKPRGSIPKAPHSRFLLPPVGKQTTATAPQRWTIFEMIVQAQSTNILVDQQVCSCHALLWGGDVANQGWVGNSIQTVQSHLGPLLGSHLASKQGWRVCGSSAGAGGKGSRHRAWQGWLK
jgi:hypothetical protein